MQDRLGQRRIAAGIGIGHQPVRGDGAEQRLDVFGHDMATTQQQRMRTCGTQQRQPGPWREAHAYADVLGVSVFEPQSRRFEFHEGPVFTQVLLADEINRAPPRTQSALLEAMAEHQVTVDGITHALPDPFFVIATQNPVDLSGTYPLPDSQLDRFLLRLALGYPGEQAERDLLAGSDRRAMIASTMPLLDVEQVREARRAVQAIHASDALIAYVQALLARSRKHAGVRVGLSPRAGLALLRAARAHALLLGRGHVVPEDVQTLFGAVAAHRLVADADAGSDAALAKAILHAVPVD